jgi:hypothetical protein
MWPPFPTADYYKAHAQAGSGRTPPLLSRPRRPFTIQLCGDGDGDAERDEHVNAPIAAPDGVDITRRSTPATTTDALGAGARTQAAGVRTKRRWAARYPSRACGGSIPPMSPTDIHVIHAAATHTMRLSRRGRRTA